jgi:uncharacterized protein YlzI (FlbEa/FlbD family)
MFITLATPDGSWIELNPGYIVFMERIVDNELPTTMIHLTTGKNLAVIQTPEEISDQQMHKMGELMVTMANQMTTMLSDMDAFDV